MTKKEIAVNPNPQSGGNLEDVIIQSLIEKTGLKFVRLI